MTLLVEPDASRVQLFESALAGAVAVVGTLAEAEDALAQAPHEFAVLIGPSVSNQDAFEFSERWRVRRARSVSIGTRHGARRATRANANTANAIT